MLELKNIKKNYSIGDNCVEVLKGINLSFRQAEFVSILGQSGCGKTTLLNIIGGLDKMTDGDLIINGISTKSYTAREWDTYRNHSIGFVFQSYNLIPHQTILQNVELALSIGGVTKQERRSRARQALIDVGLGAHLNKKPSQLSGGQCQRVSIARAIVNDPDIILADEPTGALDSDTSVQVMNILKQISKKRLVIMVTHNPDLAEKYSTRIIKMLDGRIQSDNNPLTPQEAEELQKKYKKIAENSQKIKNNSENEQNSSVNIKKKKFSAMSLWTAITLSFKNLLTKKRRTILTAFACSIGIIGIALVLSVSAGMNAYVTNVQRDSAGINYIETGANLIDYDSLLNNIVAQDLPEYPEDATGVIPYKSAIFDIKKQIINQNYIDYINRMDQDLLLTMAYEHYTTLNVLREKDGDYLWVGGTDNWTEIQTNSQYIAGQYTTLATSTEGKTFPTEYNEIALVVDKYNRINVNVLNYLGIPYDSQLSTIPYDQIVGKTFNLILNDDLYEQSTTTQGRVKFSKRTQNLETAYNDGITLKIVCVLRENKGVDINWITAGLGYTEALIDYVYEHNKDSAVVNAQKEQDYNVLTAQDFDPLGNVTKEMVLSSLGADKLPSVIDFYPVNFKAKDKIIEYLDAWNTTEIYNIYGTEKDADGNYIADKYKVSYNDMGKLFSSMVSEIVNIITYVLIAFSAVSLVVSSIMIAIITYASVIERIKEIGVLRSMGARKKDISRVFIAEACIIGLLSSIIAIVATLLLNVIINIILNSLVGVNTIASLSITTALAMVVLCVGLNLIASLIPAKLAANKDPAVALRTE